MPLLAFALLFKGWLLLSLPPANIEAAPVIRSPGQPATISDKQSARSVVSYRHPNTSEPLRCWPPLLSRGGQGSADQVRCLLDAVCLDYSSTRGLSPSRCWLVLRQHRSGPGLIPARLSLPFLACHAGVCSPRVPSHVHSCCVSFNAAASMLALPLLPGGRFRCWRLIPRP